MNEYPILDLPIDARAGDEQLGSKPKFWFVEKEQFWLFKYARPDTGEDWAEKVASELALALNIDAPEVELYFCNGVPGCACKGFINPDKDEALIHGNEVMSGYSQDYDQNKKKAQSSHTIENIFAALQTIFLNDAEQKLARSKFADYLILDALIGNTDRHHENWGLKRTRKKTMSMAPSFDHASSLGREFDDEHRSSILKSQQMEKYVLKGRGGIYELESDRHGAAPLELAILTISQYPELFYGWRTRLNSLQSDQIKGIIERVPKARASGVAKQFAFALINYSRTRILKALE